MKIVFMGTPDFAAAVLDALYKNGEEIVGVVTNPDKPKGRKGTPQPCPVKAMALTQGTPVFDMGSLKSEEALAWLTDKAPDLVVVAAFGQLIPEQILTLPKHGCVNVHASLLPAWRGAAPIQRCIMAGDQVTGVTIMQMDAGLDTGDMLAQRKVEISPDETGGSLFEKLAALGASLLLETLPHIADGTISRTPQPKESTTPYAAMLVKADGYTDFTENAGEIARKVRAMDPWPGVFTYLHGKQLKIWRAEDATDRYFYMRSTRDRNDSWRMHPDGVPAAGSVLTAEDGVLEVLCGAGILRILEVQPEGKKRMKTADFLRGYQVPCGTYLGKDKAF